MDNTMDINLSSGNNSMNSLSFTWKSFFSDGSILEQFENGIEHKFQEIKDNPNKLIRFSLINKDFSQCFTADLQLGIIIYNNYSIKDINLESSEKKENIRLIFFRRHRVTLTEAGKEVAHIITYYLGLQWNDNLGKNQKIILKIDEQGNWILEE